jgi:hypothetical protein
MRVPVKSALVVSSLRAGILVAAVAMLPAPARAGVPETTVSYLLHYFSDVDGVDVYSHHGATGVQMNEVNLSIDWAHDVVVFPATEAPAGSQEAVDAITTASRPIAQSADAFEDFVKLRDEMEATASYRNYEAGYYFSKESDYFAQMVFGGASRGFQDDNLTLSTGASYGWDDIKPLEDEDTAGIPDYRRTVHWNLVATQVVTPTTVIRLGGEFNQVTGLQHNPYRNVYVAGTNVPEQHPKNRARWDTFLRVSQYITNRSSVKIDYRYYSDDWGVSSHTLGGRLNQYITDNVIVAYRYRYYTQSSAYFYQDTYTQPGGVDGFRTGDYRLGDFGAHLFGGEILWAPNGGSIGFLTGAQLVLSYERYFNSNNFSASVYETGLRIRF